MKKEISEITWTECADGSTGQTWTGDPNRVLVMH